MGPCDDGQNFVSCQKISVVSASSGYTSRQNNGQFGFDNSQNSQLLIGLVGGSVFALFFCSLGAIIFVLKRKKIIRRDPQTIHAVQSIPVS
jgi:hypothetical protein